MSPEGGTLLPWFDGRYREQWTFAMLVVVVCVLFGTTAAGYRLRRRPRYRTRERRASDD